MKTDLLSLSELAGLWGKQYQALKKRAAARTFKEGRFSEQAAGKKNGAGVVNKGARLQKAAPTSAFDDPAIPDHVTKKILCKNHDGRALQLPVSVFARGRATFRLGGPILLHFPIPLGRSPPRQRHFIREITSGSRQRSLPQLSSSKRKGPPAAGFRNTKTPKRSLRHHPGEGSSGRRPGALKRNTSAPRWSLLKNPGEGRLRDELARN